MSLLLPLPWWPMLWLWWIWPLCPGLPPNKISPSGTPYHCERPPSRHWYTHNHRDRSYSYYGHSHRRHYSRSQSCPIHAMTGAAALEGTPCTLLSATTASHATFQPIDGPITPCSMIPTGIVAPHPIPGISPTDATHTTPWTEASLIPAAPGMQHKILSPGR